MKKLRELLSRFGGLFNRHHKDRDLDEEIESHLQFYIERVTDKRELMNEANATSAGNFKNLLVWKKAMEIARMIYIGFLTTESASSLLNLLEEERRMLNALRRKLVTRHS